MNPYEQRVSPFESPSTSPQLLAPRSEEKVLKGALSPGVPSTSATPEQGMLFTPTPRQFLNTTASSGHVSSDPRRIRVTALQGKRIDLSGEVSPPTTTPEELKASLEISDLKRKLRSIGRAQTDRAKIKSSIERAISTEKLLSPSSFSPGSPFGHNNNSTSMPPLPAPTLPASSNSSAGPELLVIPEPALLHLAASPNSMEESSKLLSFALSNTTVHSQPEQPKVEPFYESRNVRSELEMLRSQPQCPTITEQSEQDPDHFKNCFSEGQISPRKRFRIDLDFSNKRVESSKLEAKELNESGSEDAPASIKVVAPPPSRQQRTDELASSKGSQGHFQFSLSSEQEEEDQDLEPQSNYTLTPFLLIDRSQFEQSTAQRISPSLLKSPGSDALIRRRDTVVTLGPGGQEFSHFSPAAAAPQDSAVYPPTAQFKKCEEETLVFGEETKHHEDLSQSPLFKALQTPSPLSKFLEKPSSHSLPQSSNTELVEAEPGRKRNYDLSLSGLSGIASAAMKAGISAFDSAGGGSFVVGNTLFTSEKTPEAKTPLRPSSAPPSGEPGDGKLVRELRRYIIKLSGDLQHSKSGGLRACASKPKLLEDGEDELSQLRRERNSFQRVLERTKTELEKERAARVQEKGQDEEERAILSRKLQELTHELKLSMEAQQALQDQMRHLQTRPPPAPGHSVSENQYKRVVELATSLDAKCGAQELKILQLSQALDQARMDGERARQDHSKLFKEHHALERKLERVMGTRRWEAPPRSEAGSLSFSTSGKKATSHGPQPRQSNKNTKGKAARCGGEKGEMLESGSSSEDLKPGARVLDLEDLHPCTSPKFSESPILRKQSQHHRRNTVGQNLQSLAEQVAFYLSKSGQSKKESTDIFQLSTTQKKQMIGSGSSLNSRLPVPAGVLASKGAVLATQEQEVKDVSEDRQELNTTKGTPHSREIKRQLNFDSTPSHRPQVQRGGAGPGNKPIELPQSLNSTMQYKTVLDEQEKKEVEEILQAPPYPNIVAEINRAIEEEDARKRGGVVSLQEYKELAEKYSKMEYERGQLVKVLQMLGITSHESNEELAALMEMRRQAAGFQKLKGEMSKRYEQLKKSMHKQNKRWEMVSQREDKLERREQRLGDKELACLKREEVLNCKEQKMLEWEKLLEYKQARAELQCDILAERKRKKKLRRAESAQRSRQQQLQVMTLPDFYAEREPLQSEDAGHEILLSQEAMPRKPGQAQMVRAQTTKSLLQVNTKQKQYKSMLSPEDLRSFHYEPARPASSATAHFPRGPGFAHFQQRFRGGSSNPTSSLENTTIRPSSNRESSFHQPPQLDVQTPNSGRRLPSPHGFSAISPITGHPQQEVSQSDIYAVFNERRGSDGRVKFWTLEENEPSPRSKRAGKGMATSMLMKRGPRQSLSGLGISLTTMVGPNESENFGETRELDDEEPEVSDEFQRPPQLFE